MKDARVKRGSRREQIAKELRVLGVLEKKARIVDGCAIRQSPEKENLDCLENHIKSLQMGSRFHVEASK